MLRKHTLTLSLADTHTHSQLPSPQEALLDLCSSLEITGPSLPTLSRRATDTGLSKHQTYEWLCVISQRPLRRSIKRSLFLMAFRSRASQKWGPCARQLPGETTQTEVRASQTTAARKRGEWESICVAERRGSLIK